jgi:formylglycine-generating enzyme required for sulfatase activity
MSIVVGELIADEFHVIEVRTGGFSEVLIVEDPLGLRQAIKRIKEEHLRSASNREKLADQFQKECLTWRNLLKDCPYVARPNLSFRNYADLGPVLFMEVVEGPSLAELRRECGRLSVSQTARVGQQIADAMSFAHAGEILHRDLKPSNILLTRKNEVRVIDWGLCSVEEAAGFEGYAQGYVSPQRENNSSLVDKKDDVYAFGVVLYECLTGRLPPPDWRARQLREHLLGCEPLLPDALLGILINALEIDPGRRPTFAQIQETLKSREFVNDLQKREIERAFCPNCSFVSVDMTARCPLCATACKRRLAQPVRTGMRRIRAGIFTHGLSRRQAHQALAAAGVPQPSPAQVSRLAPEEPREVFLPEFDIDEFPVTNAEFEAFCKATNYPDLEGFVANRIAFPDHPVLNVTWKDALCYALWANKRLPSFLEREKAARGDQDDRPYPWGENWDSNRCNNSSFTNIVRTTDVNAFTEGERDGRSPFMVADMVGNVREWLSDGKQHGMRSVCGGSWSEACIIEGLVSSRMDANADYHDESTGFRCAADIVYDEVFIE